MTQSLTESSDYEIAEAYLARDSIRSLYDLKSYGLNTLTGEACGLGLRVLCDYNAKAQRWLATCFGVASGKFEGASPWNNGVGSIMLDPSLWPTLAVFAMLDSGCTAAVLVSRGRDYAVPVLVGGVREAKDGLTSELRNAIDRFYRGLYSTRGDSSSVFVRFISPTGTSGDGLRHVHQMSGRVV